MKARSDKLRRFEYSTTVTSVAKQVQRTELQRDIDAWLAAGNRIDVAPPFVPAPPPERKAPAESQRARLKRLKPGIYDDEELAEVRRLKAEGLSNTQVAVKMTEKVVRPRTKNGIQHICQKMGIDNLRPVTPVPHVAWDDPDEVQLAIDMLAAGSSFNTIADHINERFGRRRSGDSVRSLCKRMARRAQA